MRTQQGGFFLIVKHLLLQANTMLKERLGYLRKTQWCFVNCDTVEGGIAFRQPGGGPTAIRS